MTLISDDRNEKLRELDRREREAESIKRVAATAVAHGSIRAVEIVLELLEHEDPQVRLRAADLMLSRSIPKIAAQHVDPVGSDTIDSVDVKALRESILEEMKKR